MVPEIVGLFTSHTVYAFGFAVPWNQTITA